MLQTFYCVCRRVLLALLFCLSSGYMEAAVRLTAEDTITLKKYYRDFVRLQNGSPEEYNTLVTEYEDYLLKHELWEMFYKVKTHDGFFAVDHQDAMRAVRTSFELFYHLQQNKDSAYMYLSMGLRGDIMKMMRNPEADSLYREALVLVGDRDPKFTTLMYIYLAQVNYMTHPRVSIQWADRAIEEAEKLNSFEFMSMALGIKCYVYFMIDDPDNFERTRMKYLKVREQYDALDPTVKERGRQHFNLRYDQIIEVAKTAFDGKFDEAVEMAQEGTLNVDQHVVIFRINGMEGNYKKEQASKRLTRGFIIMTCLYILIYIMGRRRLLHKIWKHEEELKIAKEKAEEANRMKTAFIRSMSHEIRTPLNAINGFSQVICSPDITISEEEKADIRERIASSTAAITDIINELLELSAGESETIDSKELKPVKVNAICRTAMANAKASNEKGLKLEFHTNLPDSFVIRSKEDTISQILNKIIGNALKFTEKGSVKLSIIEASSHVQISITDTGIGIPEEQQEKIFDNFVKLNDFSEGAGLGLPICRQLAKSLGGDILLDKEYKTGSRFILQLPV